MYSRRDFGKLTLAGVPVALLAQMKISSTIKGVQLGAQTYSFRNLPLDGMIQAMLEVGLGDCEVYSPIKAFIEYEYAGKDDAVTEVKRCFQYCKEALA